jgi:hypothetical protein
MTRKRVAGSRESSVWPRAYAVDEGYAQADPRSSDVTGRLFASFVLFLLLDRSKILFVCMCVYTPDRVVSVYGATDSTRSGLGGFLL